MGCGYSFKKKQLRHNPIEGVTERVVEDARGKISGMCYIYDGKKRGKEALVNSRSPRLVPGSLNEKRRYHCGRRDDAPGGAADLVSPTNIGDTEPSEGPRAL